MAASPALLDLMATAAAAAITHAGLVDETGTELTGGDYARLPATASADGADVRLGGDLTFQVPAATTVGGWRAYDASTAGASWGGSDLTEESYTGAGQYDLHGADTGFTVSAD
ncbi:hypothetical protein GCM10009718_37040 [Isoptericola halotolerans]|uniref:Uncharacterized protein n=1 Tax=Isoptericola halotolerans TaxID=300560 RepID=A0ABX2A5U4_9MICO|nr:hypothetical protein [Isoptericola halotolerans]NOV98234.1 hypothetical protein [Isoptericola halotolerans]